MRAFVERALPRSGSLAVPQASRRTIARQRALLTGWLVLTDALAVALAFRLAYLVRFEWQVTLAPEVVASPATYQGLTTLLVPLWLVLFAVFDLYGQHASLGGAAESSRSFNACTMATMLVIVGTFVAPTFVVARAWLVSAWLFSFLLVATNRFVARRIVYALRRRGHLLSPAVIVGTNEEAGSLAAFLADWQSSGVRTIGLVGIGGEARGPAAGLPLLGSIEEIARIIDERGVEDVIVAITAVDRETLLRLCEVVDPLPVRLRLSSGLYELLTTRVAVRTLGTVPLMSLEKNRLSRGEAAVKRLLDWSVALPGLVLLAPLLGLIAALIKADSPGPVVHRRRVLGVAGAQFDAFKFRTMFVDGDRLLESSPEAAEELRQNHKLKADPRITRVGKWLRTFSLDELPQLVNVLLGQMSLVGPRMITPAEAVKYGRQRMNLLSVKPGITGLWQVSGRSDLSYDERVRIDMYYVRHYSVWMDLQILFVQTLPAVLKGRGAY